MEDDNPNNSGQSVQSQMEQLIKEYDEQKSEEAVESQKSQQIEEKKTKRKKAILLSVVVVFLLVLGGVLLAVNWNNWFGGGIVAEETGMKSGAITVSVDGKEITYSGAYIVDGIEATIESGEYTSNTDDQAVFVVANGGRLIIDGDVKINKTGSANFDGRGDNYSFYGLNSAIVSVGEGSEVIMNGATIMTSVSGANAVMAVGLGYASVTNTTITTTNDASRGIHATYGGFIDLDSTEISTQGVSSATIATDRGSGSIKVVGARLKTAGAGSPLIYSTGDIMVSASTGVASGARIAVIEGKNTVSLYDCEFSANGNGNRNGVDNAGVMIYQSMSGDATEGKGTFEVADSKLSILNTSSVYTSAPFFFVTNTSAEIIVTNSEISFSPEQVLILASGTGEWGRVGENGGKVDFQITDVESTNTNVTVDSISSVNAL